MFETVQDSVYEQTPFGTMFLLFFGETLALFLGGLITLFWSFHAWLMMKAMTTIEFCEKKLPKDGKGGEDGVSPYSYGVYGNICATLGTNPLTWFLPTSGSPGNGLVYESPFGPTEDSYLLEASFQPAPMGPPDPFLTRDFEVNRKLSAKRLPSSQKLFYQTSYH